MAGLSLGSLDGHDGRNDWNNNGHQRQSSRVSDIDLKDIDEIKRYKDFSTIGKNP